MQAGEVIWHPSPNFGARRGTARPELVVLHYTAMNSAEAALERLCDPAFEVSAHYLIAADGRIWQMVEEDHRAWHAGAGDWQGRADVNSRSIGIELDNSGHVPFSNPLMTALESLIGQVLLRHDISPDGVIGHSDLAPGRKIDPGPKFDWARLARQGLARPTPDHGPGEGVFRTLARAAGYTADASDEAILKALRDRYAPHRSGPASGDDLGLLAALA